MDSNYSPVNSFDNTSMGKKKGNQRKKYSPKKVYKYILKMISPNSQSKAANFSYSEVESTTQETSENHEASNNNAASTVAYDSDSVKDSTIIEDSLGIAASILSDNNNNSSTEEIQSASNEPSDYAKWSNKSQSAQSPSLQTEQDTFEDASDSATASVAPINDNDLREITGLLTNMVPLPPTPPSHSGSSRSMNAFLSNVPQIETPHYPTSESSIVDANASTEEDASGYSSATSFTHKVTTNRHFATAATAEVVEATVDAISARVSVLTSSEPTTVQADVTVSQAVTSDDVMGGSDTISAEDETEIAETDDKDLVITNGDAEVELLMEDDTQQEVGSQKESAMEKKPFEDYVTPGEDEGGGLGENLTVHDYIESINDTTYTTATMSRVKYLIAILLATMTLVTITGLIWRQYTDPDAIYCDWMRVMQLFCRDEPSGNNVVEGFVVEDSSMYLTVYDEPLDADVVATGSLDMIRSAMSVIQAALTDADNLMNCCRRTAWWTVQEVGRDLLEALKTDTDYEVITTITNAAQ